VSATLAILAFVGKLRNPEWQVLGEDKPLVELERRVGELELQNNLLRAEIDIMSKKLQYLLGSGQDGMQRQGAGRAKGKTFKAWPGNGDSVSPVDITKADLKQPFPCPVVEAGGWFERPFQAQTVQPGAALLARAQASKTGAGS